MHPNETLRPAPDSGHPGFSSCLREQVWLCLYYEFKRESEAVTEYQASDTYKSSPITAPLSTKHIAFLCPEVPAAPWLSLSDRTKCRTKFSAAQILHLASNSLDKTPRAYGVRSFVSGLTSVAAHTAF